MLLLLITFHLWVSLLFLLLFPFSVWRNSNASERNPSPKDSQLGAWRESWTLDLNQVVWLQSPAFHPLSVVFVQSLSCVWLFATPWTSLSSTVFWSLLLFHVHWVGDAIQPSHPLSPPSPFAFNHSQRESLFQWVGSSHQVAKILELQL